MIVKSELLGVAGTFGQGLIVIRKNSFLTTWLVSVSSWWIESGAMKIIFGVLSSISKIAPTST